MLLHELHSAQTWLERWRPGAAGAFTYPKGAEIFVVDGSIADERGEYGEHWWVRMPAGFAHRLQTSRGCVLWVRRGHLG